MNNDLEYLRREIRYAVPAKLTVSFLIFIVCAFAGLFGFAVLIYLFGFFVRALGGDL
jgi:hypothetical protein